MTRKKVLEGVIGFYLEQGMEGVSELMFFTNYGSNRAVMHALEPGDHLTVYYNDSSIAFSGTINPVKMNCVLRSLNRGGAAIGWFQRGFKPLDWARLFFHEPPLCATLRKKG